MPNPAATAARPSRLHGHRVLADGTWLAGASLAVEADGRIAGVATGEPSRQPERGLVLVPGMPNVHSHAFQRALAGRAERAGTGPDTFFGWREGMYALAGQLTPRDLETVATQLYVEMLEAGYTSVCEFHYLHHGHGGKRHADATATSLALIRAARATGIRLTLLPVLYMHGGFGGEPPQPAQAAFVQEPRDYLALLEALRGEQGPLLRLGLAFHSLRAVPEAAIEEVLDWRATALPGCPVHIHVAEQRAEVEQCVAWSGQRPVEWLLARHFVDAHWCLVHATHMTDDEVRGLAATGAVAGLCPSTEANLGDGLFPLTAYLAAGGHIGIGSDSQVSVSPVEELRWLEYGQRLLLGRRNVAASAAAPHSGARLFRAALAGGSQALGQPCGQLEPGSAADVVELDPRHPVLAGGDGDELLDRLVFSGNRSPVAGVVVAGRRVVANGRHRIAAAAAAAFGEVMTGLARPA